MIRDHRIEGVLVVQPAGDYGMSDSFSSVSWEPYEDLPQHLQGVEANTVIALTCTVLSSLPLKLILRVLA